MEYHSVYMIFELLYLKYQVTEDSKIKIDDLRNAFYELEYNINDINGTNQELDFDNELGTIIEDFSCIFEIFDDEISFTDEDPEDLYQTIPEFLDEEPTSIDIYMKDFISNDGIYQALKLTPPLKEMQSIFEINKNILFLYELIAKFEFEGKDTTAIKKLINFHNNNLKEFLKSIDNSTYIKIKLCLAHYNEKYLTNEAKPNINASWYLALLSSNKFAKYALSYDKIFYYIDKEREPEEEEEIESKDLVRTSFNREIGEDETPSEYLSKNCYVGDELEYFLANYILYLNNYIKHIEDLETKKLLLERKYLLLCTSDLEETEEYFLAEGNLDTLALPPYIKSWFNENSFSFLIGNFEEILNNIRIPNEKIDSPLKSNIIINLLLLKCYLELSINETIKKELTAEITCPEFYKNPNYSILTELIDNIIFPTNEINRARKKGSN